MTESAQTSQREVAPKRLKEGQVDVWLTRPNDVGEPFLCGYERSDDEHFRLRSFVNRAAQLQYLASRALIRTALSLYWGLSAES
jgi:hypothetical protein